MDIALAIREHRPDLARILVSGTSLGVVSAGGSLASSLCVFVLGTLGEGRCRDLKRGKRGWGGAGAGTGNILNKLKTTPTPNKNGSYHMP